MNTTSKPKIVHMTSVHPVFDVRIFHRECASLAQLGYPVVLVAPHTHDEVQKGVQIRAVPKAKNRLERMLFTTWRVYRRALAEASDLYHLHDPELIPMGFLLRMRGKKVIYDVHEDVPTNLLSKHWIPPLLRRLIAQGMAWLEGLAGQFFSGIVTVTPPIASRFPAHKTVLVQNFPHSEEIAKLKNTTYPHSSYQILYAGSLSKVRGLSQMLEAMTHLQDTPLQLVLAGNFSPPELESELKAHPSHQQIKYVGYQNRQEMLNLLSSSRIGLAVLQPIPSFLRAQPTKMYEYMMAGIPFVASDFPLWRASVGDVECGLFVDPKNPEAIAKAIRWLYEHPQEAEAMGKRGRQLIEEKLNWNAEVAKLAMHYQALI